MRAPSTCPAPDCDVAVPPGEQCPAHPRRRRPDAGRGTAAERGYGSKWKRYIAPSFIRRHPTCVDCGDPSQVPDHDPVSRRDLVAAGVAHPDADEHLVPRCIPCHNKRSATVRG